MDKNDEQTITEQIEATAERLKALRIALSNLEQMVAA